MNVTRTVGPTAAFRHEALFYGGKTSFLESTVPFIREGIRADEPVLAVLERHKIEWLTEALGDDALDVFFEDMREVGANPARLIAIGGALAPLIPRAPRCAGSASPRAPTEAPRRSTNAAVTRRS